MHKVIVASLAIGLSTPAFAGTPFYPPIQLFIDHMVSAYQGRYKGQSPGKLPSFYDPSKHCQWLSTGTVGYGVHMKLAPGESAWFLIDVNSDSSFTGQDDIIVVADPDEMNPPGDQWIPGNWREVFWPSIFVPYGLHRARVTRTTGNQRPWFGAMIMDTCLWRLSPTTVE